MYASMQYVSAIVLLLQHLNFQQAQSQLRSALLVLRHRELELISLQQGQSQLRSAQPRPTCHTLEPGTFGTSGSSAIH